MTNIIRQLSPHRYEFRFASDAALAFRDPNYLSSMRDAWKTALRAALEACGGKSPHYVYDFGGIGIVASSSNGSKSACPVFPIRDSLPRRAPPEDVVGLPGYAVYFKTLADPDHLEHEGLLEWDRLILIPTRSISPTSRYFTDFAVT